MATAVKGRGAIESLARRFPQLYVAPADDAAEAGRLARVRGTVPDGANLDHFASTDEDELREVETPAGPIEVLFLKDRSDFETFLQIIGHKSQPVPIARTVGAVTYLGIADWGAIAAAHAAYVEAGGQDWGSEFARLAKQPGMFRAELVVISEGPYSNVPAAETPYGEDEWTRVSREIRLHHECAHVVCRRLMPDLVAPVWDEITADVVGLICATSDYDASLAGRFLGVTASGFAGGRLSEYLDEDQMARIDEVAAEVYAAIGEVAHRFDAEAAQSPFDFLLELKRAQILVY